jgi:hypothetical protein
MAWGQENPRLESHHRLAVLELLLPELQAQGDHEFDEAREHALFVRLDNVGVDGLERRGDDAHH